MVGRKSAWKLGKTLPLRKTEREGHIGDIVDDAAFLLFVAGRIRCCKAIQDECVKRSFLSLLEVRIVREMRALIVVESQAYWNKTMLSCIGELRVSYVFTVPTEANWYFLLVAHSHVQDGPPRHGVRMISMNDLFILRGDEGMGMGVVTVVHLCVTVSRKKWPFSQRNDLQEKWDSTTEVIGLSTRSEQTWRFDNRHGQWDSNQKTWRWFCLIQAGGAWRCGMQCNAERQTCWRNLWRC